LQKCNDLVLLHIRQAEMTVMSRFCGTSDEGQQFTFSTVAAGQFPDETDCLYTSGVL
jgi:hypothetical protein